MKCPIVAATCLAALVALAAAAAGDDAALTASSASLLNASPGAPTGPTPAPLRSSTAAETMSSVDWTHAPPPTPTPATNMSSIDFLLDVFNADRLEGVWGEQADFITGQCHSDMAEFFSARRRAHIWALKMSDASGKYGGGYFFGNTYWMGSQTMCSNLAHNTSAHRKDMGHLSPPFAAAFYVVRADLQLPEAVAETQRTVNLGLCLPKSCGARDVGRLVDLSVQTANQVDPRAAALRQFKVTSVRMPAFEYVFWEDPTFWVLIVVSFLVGLLLAGGTAYDLVLEHRKRTGLNHSGYDNYSFGLGAPRLVGMRDKGDFGVGVRLDLTVPAVSTVSAAAPTAPGRGPATESSLYSSSSELATSVYTGSAASSGDSCASRAPSSASSDTDPTSVWVELLLSFSLRRNIATIFDKSVGADTIPTIHGLKAISMAWVVLGHTCIVAFKYSDNMELRGLVEKELLFQTISNGAFSVDTFFMISGLLVSFLYFRTTAKLDVTKITKTTGVRSNALEFVGLLIYRFLRLTAPYLFSLGLVQVTMKWFYHNSVFEPPTMDHINCPNYWWRNVLYINTLFPVKDMCMLWSWYLADDTQFYVLGVILLILATRLNHIRLSAATLLTFMVSSWCTTAYIAYSNQHMPAEDDPLALFDKIYDKPWTRLGPYLVGMAVGWILFKTDCKIRMSKVTVLLGWSLSFACLLSLVYGLYGAVLDPITAAAYSSLSHSAWAMSLSWIVIACSCGYGGPVNKILSWTLLYPFSRVTYCAYLVHPVVIRLLSMKMDAPLHLGAYTIFILFLGMLFASYLFAFVLSLAFEAPVVTMLRLISPKRKQGRDA